MSDESDLVGELRALAGADARDRDGLTLVHEGVPIDVSYSSGSSSSLTLSALYDAHARPLPPAEGYRAVSSGRLPASRPLKILLRPEEMVDVHAKVQLVSVEFQTGDEAFDPRVYVETDTTDPEVLRAVLNAEVRAAVLTLFENGFLRVAIDDDRRVTATIVEFAQSVPSVGRGAKVAAAFAQLLRNLPALTHVDAPRGSVPLRGLTWLLGAIGTIGWATNVGYTMIVVGAFDALVRRTEGPSALAVILSIVTGIVAGLYGGGAYGRLVRDRARGRSNAHKLASTAMFCGFGGVSVLAYTVVLLASMALAHP